MAGKRRADGKPTRRVNRARVRMDRLNQALGATHDPRVRVAIAVDHFRSAFAVHPDPISAEQVVQFLVDAGNRLYTKSLGGPNDRDAE